MIGVQLEQRLPESQVSSVFLPCELQLTPCFYWSNSVAGFRHTESLREAVRLSAWYLHHRFVDMVLTETLNRQRIRGKTCGRFSVASLAFVVYFGVLDMAYRIRRPYADCGLMCRESTNLVSLVPCGLWMSYWRNIAAYDWLWVCLVQVGLSGKLHSASFGSLYT